MTIQHTWSTVIFREKEAYIEATLNYEKQSFSLSHGNNDQNVTFDDDIDIALDRAKCVTAALKYIKAELFS